MPIDSTYLNISGIIVKLEGFYPTSGDWRPLMVNASGEISIYATVADIVTAKISGEIVLISGQPVSISGEVVDVESEDINDLLKLFDETYDFTYNASGDISQITVDTEDADGNSRTITYIFTYNSSGDISQINKTVS